MAAPNSVAALEDFELRALNQRTIVDLWRIHEADRRKYGAPRFDRLLGTIDKFNAQVFAIPNAKMWPIAQVIEPDGILAAASLAREKLNPDLCIWRVFHAL
jgi:hypothetical protein